MATTTNKKELKDQTSKVLKAMAKVKKGAELEEINAILAERGELEEKPVEIIIEDVTPEEAAELAEAEKNEGKAKKERKAKTPKEPREPRAKRTLEHAQAQLAEAKENIGKYIDFDCTKTKQRETGVIVSVRLDTRSNFVQYRIKCEAGEFGKGVDDSKISIGAMAPKTEKPVKEKAPKKSDTAAKATAEDVSENLSDVIESNIEDLS